MMAWVGALNLIVTMSWVAALNLIVTMSWMGALEAYGHDGMGGGTRVVFFLGWSETKNVDDRQIQTQNHVS